MRANRLVRQHLEEKAQRLVPSAEALQVGGPVVSTRQYAGTGEGYDGGPQQAAETVRRKRAVFYNALRYAVREARLIGLSPDQAASPWRVGRTTCGMRPSPRG